MRLRTVGLGLLSWLVLATAGHAEAIRFAAEAQAGDRYALSLRSSTGTDAFVSTAERKDVATYVEYAYDATVEVLAVDRDGLPTRERHTGATLETRTHHGSGELFEARTIEIQRDDKGTVFAYWDGYRVEERTERILRNILATQFERGTGPALLAPARDVAVGERWSLDRATAKRFLHEQGLRVKRFDGDPTATLVTGGAAPVVEFRIPIAWFEAFDMPEGLRPSDSEGLWEGRVTLPPQGPATVRSKLHLTMEGAVHTGTPASRSHGFTLRRLHRGEQQVAMMSPTAAGLALRRDAGR